MWVSLRPTTVQYNMNGTPMTDRFRPYFCVNEVRPRAFGRRCVHTQEALLLDGNDGNARAGRCSPAMLLCDTVSANCSHPHHGQVMSALAVFMEIMWKR